jgi:hypothetical protein
MPDAELARANALLAAHSLAAVRLHAWDPVAQEARFVVAHLEWPAQVFGELCFAEVSYLQCPAQTSWGYQLRIVTGVELPSRGDLDASDIIYELFTPDGKEPSAFIVAERLTCVPRSNPGPGA